ncbi:PQQ-dependent sugar dehydrogenase [Deinococcus yavapaiensis]|uniref:Glucose/arabinose dehydrogenase n=1 Tax=Deinococcus yavapaiensis KR-236 TaxID=694435 RepID=A0A318S5L9_9DEIO|nr:sorbosone dehydrogenase family protein [Deinococcus yavapaiensis]PYE53855.1 glucose/arabinose dehydrogenase [Deinococcus yavapaiensis KR-236]
MQTRDARPRQHRHPLQHRVARTTASFRRAASVLTGTLCLTALTAASGQGIASKLNVPSGFHVTEYASGFESPRLLAVAPNGDVFVSDMGAGTVFVLPDRNRDGKPDGKSAFATGLRQPHGLAFHNGYLYVANTDAVVRFAYKSGDTKASGAAQKLVDLPSGSGHSTRTVTFGRDGRMYVSIGSSCNVCEESDPRRAAVWAYDANGKNGKAYATGLRNAVGLEWFGGTLYATNNGRDMLGDDIPPESFYKLQAGGNYGWPYCYTLSGKQVFDQQFGRKTAAVCTNATPAFATVTAHSAPLGLAFYTGTKFPTAYRNQMFVALHGSWNRTERTGYKVVMVNPQTGEAQDFVTGFLDGQTVRGRPVDLAVLPDGAMLLTDDDNGVIYRITYGQ